MTLSNSTPAPYTVRGLLKAVPDGTAKFNHGETKASQAPYYPGRSSSLLTFGR